jgi:hypothetical protein
MTKTKLLMIAALAPVVIATLNVSGAAAHSGSYPHHHPGDGYKKKRFPKYLPQGPEIRTPNKPLCTRNGVCR